MMNNRLNEAIQAVENNPDYRLLKRLSEHFGSQEAPGGNAFTATIIDLETMGMDAKNHEIIEIGLLSFTFSNDGGILGYLIPTMN